MRLSANEHASASEARQGASVLCGSCIYAAFEAVCKRYKNQNGSKIERLGCALSFCPICYFEGLEMD